MGMYNQKTRQADLSVQERLTKNRRHKRWVRGVSWLAALMVFVTTYSMILPTLTATRTDLSASDLPQAHALQAGDLLTLSDAIYAKYVLPVDEPETGADGDSVNASAPHVAIVVNPAADPQDDALLTAALCDEDGAAKLVNLSLDSQEIACVDRVYVERYVEDFPAFSAAIMETMDAVESAALLEEEQTAILRGAVEHTLGVLSGEIEEDSEVTSDLDVAEEALDDAALDEAAIEETDLSTNDEYDMTGDMAADAAEAAQEEAETAHDEDAEAADIEESTAGDAEAAEAADASAAAGSDREPAGAVDGRREAEALTPSEAEADKTGKASELTDAARLQLEKDAKSAALPITLSRVVGGVTVTAAFGRDVFPAGVQMLVHPEESEAYAEQVADATGRTRCELKPLDIEFVVGGQEVEPDGSVQIAFAADFLDEQANPEVIHVTDEGSAELLDATMEDGQLTLTTVSFSVYVIAYTVDFHYGEYTYSLPGDGTVLLSDLLSTLGIRVSADEIESVTFSNTDYLNVQPVQGEVLIGNEYRTIEGRDWLLTSLLSFETDEALRVVLKNGEAIAISVTDPEYLHDIRELLTGVSLEINGVAYEPGNSDPALYRSGSNYTLSLSFKENPTKQFAIESGAVLTYPLPSGFVLPDDYETTIDISLGRKGTLTGNTVKYNKETGNLEIRWNESNTELFEFFKSSNSAFVKIDLEGKIDAPEGKILFSDGAAINVEKENLHNATVAKDGTYNRQNGTVDYTVTVKSDGTTENLTLTDIPGAALKYKGDCVLDRDASSASASTMDGVSISADGSSYKATIDSMQDGEVLVFKYSARIDINNISVSGNASFDEMGNTVTIAGDSDPTDNTATHYERDIVFSSLQKDTTGVSDKYTRDGTKYRAIHWEIVTNENPNISLGGTTVSDFIDDEVHSLCGYAGSGITVKAYDAEGNLKYTQEVSWDEMDVNTESDKSWTYTIPEEDKDPYKYVITYDTEINMDEVNKKGEQVFVRNTARGKGGEDKALEIIDPEGSGISFSKNIESYTTDTVTWRMTFTMSGDAYDKEYITLTDTLPGRWVSNDQGSQTLYKEMYYLNKDEIVGSLDIRGLYEGESYTVSSNIENNNNYKWTVEKLTIDFYKDQAKTQKGLKAPEAGKDESRTITVLLTTKYDPAWPQKVKEAIENKYGTIQDYAGQNWLYKHENIAELNGNKKTDSVTIQSADVVKRVLRNYYSDGADWTWEIRDYWKDESLDGKPITDWNGKTYAYGGYTYCYVN